MKRVLLLFVFAVLLVHETNAARRRSEGSKNQKKRETGENRETVEPSQQSEHRTQTMLSLVSSINLPPKEICEQDKEVGEGLRMITMWYYDKKTKDCKFLPYRGRNGNANRFINRYECLAFCKFNVTNMCTDNLVKCGSDYDCKLLEPSERCAVLHPKDEEILEAYSLTNAEDADGADLTDEDRRELWKDCAPPHVTCVNPIYRTLRRFPESYDLSSIGYSQKQSPVCLKQPGYEAHRRPPPGRAVRSPVYYYSQEEKGCKQHMVFSDEVKIIHRNWQAWQQAKKDAEAKGQSAPELTKNVFLSREDCMHFCAF